jgi:hypothetical protein
MSSPIPLWEPSSAYRRSVMLLIQNPRCLESYVIVSRCVPPVEESLSESAKRIIEMMEPIQEGNGYIRVELFCQQHLESLHQFVSESIDEVLTSKFQSYAE